ncbi:hypothetical protein DC522_12135 [Microvirga sp. KLBC 81]|nr:hypothetical protein DC522_12135 [Microvirga sp. KLBC 81]
MLAICEQRIVHAENRVHFSSTMRQGRLSLRRGLMKGRIGSNQVIPLPFRNVRCSRLKRTFGLLPGCAKRRPSDDFN